MAVMDGEVPHRSNAPERAERGRLLDDDDGADVRANDLSVGEE